MEEKSNFKDIVKEFNKNKFQLLIRKKKYFRNLEIQSIILK